MFGFLVTLFDIFLYNPLFNALIWLYNVIPGHDFGMAVVLLTLIIRVILYPVASAAVKSQRVLQKLQPKLKEIQQLHKDDKEKQATATMELYRQEKINPFSGLLLMIIQFPILIALYRVFWQGFQAGQLSHLYPFVANPGHVNTVFLRLADLSHPNLVFAVLAGITQFVQTKMLLPKPQKKSKGDVTDIVQRQMVYLFPVITVVILYKLPSVLGLYWTVSALFSIVQQYFIIKKHPLPQ